MALATQTQIRRDTASNLAGVTPVIAEPGMDLTNGRFILGDGITPGGIPHLNVFDAQSTKFNYATAGGTADALTIALPFAPIAYAQPLSIRFKATATNTGSVTVNVNALGTKNIYKLAEGAIVPLEAGDLVNGAFYEAIYDGVQFILFGFAPQGGGDFELMEEIVLGSTAATVDFDPANFDPADKRYLIDWAAFCTGGSIVNVLGRISIDGGVSYVSSATYAQLNWVQGASSYNNATFPTSTSILLGEMDNNSSRLSVGTLEINPEVAISARKVNYQSRAASQVSQNRTMTDGYATVASRMNGFRFLTSAASYNTGGVFRIWKLK